MKNRKAYNFYRSYYELADEMTDEQKGQYYHSILKMQFEDVIEYPKDPLARMAFKGQMFTLNQQMDGFRNVQKRGESQVNKPTPKQPPTEAPLEGSKEAPNQQVQVKEQDKVKVQVKVKQTLEDRMVDFQKKISPLISEKFTREDANDFYRYWTEMNEGGYKMRFEKEKTWNIKSRIVTWVKNKKVARKNKDDGRISAKDYFNNLRNGTGLPQNENKFIE